MINKILFENYRCFENNLINLKDLTILVGKNNARKSTIIEALRMAAYATRKACHTTFKEIPTSFGIGIGKKGIRIDVENLKIDLRSIVYFYEDKIAKVTVFFENKCKIEILASTVDAYAILYSPDKTIINTKSKANGFPFDNMIAILPQIGLIKEKERLLEKTTVINHKDTYLSSRHFRNEILRDKDKYWNSFKKMAESSWDDLRIISIDYNYDSLDEEYILFMIEVNHLLAEIGLVGSGLQMWLQIIWFICHSKDFDTIILDEPDVYMHPDLQLRLLSLLKKLNRQIIIATHSVEIISDVSPDKIVIVDRKNSPMKYANSLNAVQKMVDNIGSIQNLSLLRIGQKKKCLFVEGQDVQLLSKIYQSIYPNKENIFSDLPYVEINGFCNLSEAFGTSKLLFKETNNSIKSICILDRDYYCDELIQKRQQAATDNHLILHIWEKKELENYLIIEDVLYALSQNKISYDDFLAEMENIVDKYESDVKAQIFAHKKEENRSTDDATLFQNTEIFMNEHWTTLEEKINICPGKKLLKNIMDWFQTKLNISISKTKIINQMTEKNVSVELLTVFDTLENL